jgi:hypothetical protein
MVAKKSAFHTVLIPEFCTYSYQQYIGVSILGFYQAKFAGKNSGNNKKTQRG